MDSLMESDLYELIGVEKTASVQEIKKAYRRKALCCHPDKNPNNPKAAELFHELSRALEILTDVSARAAYDKVINAKYQAKLRVKEFDSKRKKLKEDLEAREKAYKQTLDADYNVQCDKDKLQAEIERLQMEGSKQVEEEIAFMKKHLEERLRVFYKESEVDCGSYKVKVKWKSDKNEIYGDITALVISSAREGRALVEYQRKNDAEIAVNTELGLAQNPLKLQKLWHAPKESGVPAEQIACNVINFAKNGVNQSMSDIEFEHFVLNNLKRAEERKRFLEKSND
ncbi:DnaJ like protein subfamily C member 17 [Habropoda laboriosa]|uniref:DnaJ homolog subfamily C member 17 n=1 Tax=Habropoda laboriosa TaxID=597456 RepID=A0A0L7QXL6_9HYME|nr:DnaJ like protein subfamily C member 17 [Habropoda laboriosa]